MSTSNLRTKLFVFKEFHFDKKNRLRASPIKGTNVISRDSNKCRLLKMKYGTESKMGDSSAFGELYDHFASAMFSLSSKF